MSGDGKVVRYTFPVTIGFKRQIDAIEAEEIRKWIGRALEISYKSSENPLAPHAPVLRGARAKPPRLELKRVPLKDGDWNKNRKGVTRS